MSVSRRCFREGKALTARRAVAGHRKIRASASQGFVRGRRNILPPSRVEFVTGRPFSDAVVDTNRGPFRGGPALDNGFLRR